MKTNIFLIMLALAMVGCASKPTTPAPPPPAGSDPNLALETCETPAEYRGAFKYCVDKYKGGNTDVIWKFHGFGNTEKDWYEGLGGVQQAKLREKLGANSPTVVTIEYKGDAINSLIKTLCQFSPTFFACPYKDFNAWLLSVPNSRQKGNMDATMKYVTETIMPYIEKRFALKPNRILYGVSMGGFNGANLCMRKPDLWKKCILQQAMVIQCRLNIFAPDGKKCMADLLMSSQFNDNERDTSDPLAFALSVDGKKLPPILLTATKSDEWELLEPDRELYRRLKVAGANITMIEFIGTHEYFEPEPIGNFILQ